MTFREEFKRLRKIEPTGRLWTIQSVIDRPTCRTIEEYKTTIRFLDAENKALRVERWQLMVHAWTFGVALLILVGVWSVQLFGAHV